MAKNHQASEKRQMGQLAAFMDVVRNHDDEERKKNVAEEQLRAIIEPVVDGTVDNFEGALDEQDMLKNIMFGLEDYAQHDKPVIKNEVSKE